MSPNRIVALAADYRNVSAVIQYVIWSWLARNFDVAFVIFNEVEGLDVFRRRDDIDGWNVRNSAERDVVLADSDESITVLLTRGILRAGDDQSIEHVEIVDGVVAVAAVVNVNRASAVRVERIIAFAANDCDICAVVIPNCVVAVPAEDWDVGARARVLNRIVPVAANDCDVDSTFIANGVVALAAIYWNVVAAVANGIVALATVDCYLVAVIENGIVAARAADECVIFAVFKVRHKNPLLWKIFDWLLAH